MSCELADFFSGKVLFLTGATGFLGRILLEKLLYSCDVRKVYLLVREKKGKKQSERYKELFEGAVFERLKKKRQDYMDLVEMVIGDCNDDDLGVAAKDWQMLEEQVHFVVHCAATVRFDQKLRTAYKINVESTRSLIEHAKNMKQLQAFLYVSTAYSNCPRKELDEVVMPPPMTYKQLKSLLETFPNDDDIARLTPAIIGEWPNTYVFTKCICEHMISVIKEDLPLAMIRPSMVSSTYREPLEGWVNNFYGAMGVLHGVGVGLIRTLHCQPELKGDIVPVDYVVNAMMAALLATNKTGRINELKIYNMVAAEHAITWGFLIKVAMSTTWEIPSMHAVWKVSFRPNRYKWKYQLDVFRLHTIYAYCGDLFCKIVGKKPMFMEGYAKLHKFLAVTSYFSNREWNFRWNNTRDLWKQLDEKSKDQFEFRIETVDYKEYIWSILRGGRIHLTNDPLDTVPAAKRKLLLFTAAHYIILALMYYAIFLFFKFFYDIFYPH